MLLVDVSRRKYAEYKITVFQMVPARITYSLFAAGPSLSTLLSPGLIGPWPNIHHLIHYHHLLIRQDMIYLDRQGMEKHLRMCVSFNIIGGPVQLFDDGFLLADIGYLI